MQEGRSVRDNFPKPIIETLAKRVGMRCSNPGCISPHTSGPHSDPSKSVNLGVAAHITAAAPGGPRYDPSLTPEQRSASDNGIWLCITCSTLIDKDDPAYAVNLLRRWKKDTEHAALLAIQGKPAQSKGGDHNKPYFSCFISYATSDDAFARKLYDRLVAAGVDVWFAPENIHAGQKLHEQIYEAIRQNAKLLLVLSEHSINSEWVKTEIRNARKSEVRDGKQKLFPIRLIDMPTLRDWECFDADIGKDSAVEIREYFIPDFSGWENAEAFDRETMRLLKDFKIAE
jgi:TIR domain